MCIIRRKGFLTANCISDKCINGYSKLVMRGAIDPEDVEQVKIWFKYAHPHAIEEDEQDFITHKDDLIPVLPKVKSRFRNFLEWTLLQPHIIRPYFVRERDEINTIKDSIHDSTVWYDDKKVERFFTLAVGVGGLSMLIGPLWVLEYVSRSAIRLGVITSFICLFFILVTVATTAKIFEAMAAATACSGVDSLRTKWTTLINIQIHVNISNLCTHPRPKKTPVLEKRTSTCVAQMESPFFKRAYSFRKKGIYFAKLKIKIHNYIDFYKIEFNDTERWVAEMDSNSIPSLRQHLTRSHIEYCGLPLCLGPPTPSATNCGSESSTIFDTTCHFQTSNASCKLSFFSRALFSPVSPLSYSHIIA